MRTVIDESLKESLQIEHVDIAPMDAAILRNFISQTSLQERTTLYKAYAVVPGFAGMRPVPAA